MSWIRHARYRMGTIWEMAVWSFDRLQGLRAVDEAFAEVARLEGFLSRFMPDSQVARLARAAGQHAVPIAPELYDLLALAQRVSACSDGAFDVTMGPVVSLWERAAASAVLPSPEELDAARVRVDYRAVCLQPEGPTAALRQAGMAVDLGAIGKGFAVDRAVARLEAHGYTEGWVNAGGNIRFLGRWGREVAVRDPRQPNHVLMRVPVDGGAVSTSANYERGWDIGGRRYGHLLDPRTGWPTETCLSVTVLAPSAALADALSTACFVVGPEEGRMLCARFDGVEALWVVGESAQTMRIVTTPGLVDRVAMKEASRHADIPVA